MLSGRGLCDELITRPEESYRLWCVVVCDLETSIIGAPYIYDISSLRVKHKMNFDFPYKFCWEHFLFQEELKEIRSKIILLFVYHILIKL